MTDARASFERLFAGSDDPWRYRSSWYEARKRDITLACLPHARYQRAFEPGCANGELTAALAGRCDAVLGFEGVEAAIALARQRTAKLPQVRIDRGWIPGDWPDGRFDLVLLSEMGFYLDRAGLADAAEKLVRSLDGQGTVLACHWRGEIKGFTLDGEAVHEALDNRLRMRRVVHHEEPDFVLDVWTADGLSVAEREKGG
jgi:SAM-dependent methyltransferase